MFEQHPEVFMSLCTTIDSRGTPQHLLLTSGGYLTQNCKHLYLYLQLHYNNVVYSKGLFTARVLFAARVLFKARFCLQLGVLFAATAKGIVYNMGFVYSKGFVYSRGCMLLL